jgi:hypothetical protein
MIRVISEIFTKLPKVNSDPIGEHSPNLVTLDLRLTCLLPDFAFSELILFVGGN